MMPHAGRTTVPSTILRLNELREEEVVSVTRDFLVRLVQPYVAHLKNPSDGSRPSVQLSARVSAAQLDDRLMDIVSDLTVFAQTGVWHSEQLYEDCRSIYDLTDPIRPEYIPVPLSIVLGAAETRFALHKGQRVTLDGLAALASVRPADVGAHSLFGEWETDSRGTWCDAATALRYLHYRNTPGFESAYQGTAR
jgi:hypothetical protein